MRIQKKWLAAFVITGLGGLFFNLGFNQVSKRVEKSSNAAMEIMEKKAHMTTKADRPKKTRLIKASLDDSHIEYADVSLEVVDEMNTLMIQMQGCI
jgi:hypothetical protein